MWGLGASTKGANLLAFGQSVAYEFLKVDSISAVPIA
jgi:hypothetical protein